MSEVPAAAPLAPATFPGKTLGIVGIVLAFVFSPAGIIVSAIARSQSKAAGFKNTPAKVGLILSIIFLVLTIISIVAGVALTAAALSALCEGQAAGVYQSGATTITCP